MEMSIPRKLLCTFILFILLTYNMKYLYTFHMYKIKTIPSNNNNNISYYNTYYLVLIIYSSCFFFFNYLFVVVVVVDDVVSI